MCGQGQDSECITKYKILGSQPWIPDMMGSPILDVTSPQPRLHVDLTHACKDTRDVMSSSENRQTTPKATKSNAHGGQVIRVNRLDGQ